MINNRLIIAVITVCFLWSESAGADNYLKSHVLDMAGGRSTNALYTHISSVGQSGGFDISSAPSCENQAGFLTAFYMQPDLDTDGDGLADEADPDNDNDMVNDEDEITGSIYAGPAVTDPNNADTDGDGFNDGDEAIAASDPTDDTMYLHITSIEAAGITNGVIIGWQAQGGKYYKVMKMDDLLTDDSGTWLGTVLATGGTGVWYNTTANYTDVTSPPATGRYYYITVLP